VADDVRRQSSVFRLKRKFPTKFVSLRRVEILETREGNSEKVSHPLNQDSSTANCHHRILQSSGQTKGSCLNQQKAGEILAETQYKNRSVKAKIFHVAARFR
jgi:hypothetical protein